MSMNSYLSVVQEGRNPLQGTCSAAARSID
jgi:hypothetical protein